MCHWDDRDKVVQTRGGRRNGSASPSSFRFAFLALSQNAEAQRACATTLVAKHHPASSDPLWTGERYRHDRIRVAYLSADFHEHAVAYLIAGLLEQHDHARFEITGIAFGPDIQASDAHPDRSDLRSVVDVRRKSDAEVAGMMRELEIDIAVDLMGLTNGICGPAFLPAVPRRCRSITWVTPEPWARTTSTTSLPIAS